MDPLKTYDYLERARRKLLDWTRPLTHEQFTRAFPFGLHTLSRTLAHMALAEWGYWCVLKGYTYTPLLPREEWIIDDEALPPLPEVERVWREQAARTRAAIAEIGDWTKEFEYRSGSPEQPVIVTVSPGDVVTQLVLHEVHHRAQAMAMLRQFGIAAEGLDYNDMMDKWRHA
ncbi:MAG TPA: DinB family protein [bacterium]|nr:DinB family protein [bacterium]